MCVVDDDGEARHRRAARAVAVDLAQDDRRPLVERQMIARLLQLRGELFLLQHAIGRQLAAGEKLAVRGDVLIERHLIRAVAPAPGTAAGA